MLRSILFTTLFYVVMVALMVLGLPMLLLGGPAIRRLAAFWGGASLGLLRLVCGLGIEVRGRENIPAGAVLVAAKHQSFWEVFVLTTLLPDFTFVMKRELARIPLFGLYVSRSGQIAIDRARGRAALAQIVEQARLAFTAGRQFVIFPEGTRRRPGAPPQYKFGVAFIYGETGIACLPVALNSGLFWPRRSVLRRPGTVVIEFLPAIEPGLDRGAFLQRLEATIETASNRLIAEACALDGTLAAAAGSHFASG